MDDGLLDKLTDDTASDLKGDCRIGDGEDPIACAQGSPILTSGLFQSRWKASGSRLRG